jgi:acyl-CoA thioester hydrolase
MECKCTLRVRTYECDGYGHVNNANYLNYLEYARYEFLREIGLPHETVVNAGYGMFIARIEIDYKRPAVTDDLLTIKSWPVKKGSVSGTLTQEILRGEELLAKANVTWAFVDGKTGSPVKIPEGWNVPGLDP